jgi:hypothetical protein
MDSGVLQRARQLMVRHFSAPVFTGTHLDAIPSIPGNVDLAHALLQRKVRYLNGLQQPPQQHAFSGIEGYFMVFGLKQTICANHFTLVQVRSHSIACGCAKKVTSVRAALPRSTTTVMPRHSRSSSTVRAAGRWLPVRRTV